MVFHPVKCEAEIARAKWIKRHKTEIRTQPVPSTVELVQNFMHTGFGVFDYNIEPVLEGGFYWKFVGDESIMWMEKERYPLTDQVILEDEIAFDEHCEKNPHCNPRFRFVHKNYMYKQVRVIQKQPHLLMMPELFNLTHLDI